jgi:hypothetical protein
VIFNQYQSTEMRSSYFRSMNETFAMKTSSDIRSLWNVGRKIYVRHNIWTVVYKIPIWYQY